MKNAVEKSERLRWLNQYGYEMDAFDKYRMAMHSSRNSQLRVTIPSADSTMARSRLR